MVYLSPVNIGVFWFNYEPGMPVMECDRESVTPFLAKDFRIAGHKRKFSFSLPDETRGGGNPVKEGFF